MVTIKGTVDSLREKIKSSMNSPYWISSTSDHNFFFLLSSVNNDKNIDSYFEGNEFSFDEEAYKHITFSETGSSLYKNYINGDFHSFGILDGDELGICIN